MVNKSVFIIKPYGMRYEKQISKYLIDNGFIITRQTIRYLEPEEIAYVYNDIFSEIHNNYDVQLRNNMINNHFKHLLSNMSKIMIITREDDYNFYKSVLKIRGEGKSAETCNPNSIRFLFPGKGVFNSCHASISNVEAENDIKIFINQKIPFSDHELFDISDEQYADSIGYDHNNKVLSILTYKQNKDGDKIINRKKYYKRFFERNNDLSFSQQVKKKYKEIIINEYLDEQLVRIPYTMIKNRYWSWSSYKNLASCKNNIGRTLRDIQGQISNSIILGLSGSALAGQTENLPDVDIIVYGKSSMKNIIDFVIDTNRSNEISKYYEFSCGSVQNKIYERIRFSPNYGVKLAETAINRKANYKLIINNHLVSFWCRYFPYEMPKIQIKTISEASIPFTCTISDDTYNHFMPIIYKCVDGHYLLTYNRFFKGALKPGDQLCGKTSLIDAIIDGKQVSAYLLRHDDFIDFS